MSWWGWGSRGISTVVGAGLGCVKGGVLQDTCWVGSD
jgi:hypothetical protein